ncbi:hypothetical protein B0H13DRAFT_2269730 [Mycena leptocephala]|nr:hypothetical protein B0H13DRAFT_2269730 [Mycena leptocephala]
MGSTPSTLLIPKRGAHFLVAVGYSAPAPSASPSESGSSTAAKLRRATEKKTTPAPAVYESPTQPVPGRLKARKFQIQKASSPSAVRSAALHPRMWKQAASSSSAVLTDRCRPSGSLRVHGERRGYPALTSSSSPPAVLASTSVGSTVSTVVTTPSITRTRPGPPTWTRNSQPRFYRLKQTRWNRWTEIDSCLGRAQD